MPAMDSTSGRDSPHVRSVANRVAAILVSARFAEHSHPAHLQRISAPALKTLEGIVMSMVVRASKPSPSRMTRVLNAVKPPLGTCRQNRLSPSSDDTARTIQTNM